MLASTPSPVHSLVELKLGGDLHAWVSARRAAGSSWQTIADELSDLTGVQVSREWIRRRQEATV